MKIKTNTVKLFDVLRRLQQATEESINSMAEMMDNEGQFTPISVTMIEGEPYLLHGYRRLMAALKLGWEDINADPIPCAPEQIIYTAITAGNQDEKSYVWMGSAVKMLKEWSEINLPQLQDENPKLDRAMTWVAKRMGFKSKDTAYKLLKMVDAPMGMFCLNELDTGELKSLQQAYDKALGIVKTPPVRKPLSPNCAPCEFFKDNEGRICPRHVFLKETPDYWERIGNSQPPQQPEEQETPETPEEGGHDNE